VDEVLEYLESLPEPQQGTLKRLRRELLRLVPQATEGISYQMPAIFLSGKPIAGYFAFKNHLGYFPHSSVVVPLLAEELTQYKVSKAGFQFAFDHQLPRKLMGRLVGLRMKELEKQYPELFLSYSVIHLT
jgi:uncharacterized protein YdhG (YjbR/CyaY superfamily)